MSVKQRETISSTRRYINKDELDLIEEWTVGWHYVIIVLGLITCGDTSKASTWTILLNLHQQGVLASKGSGSSASMLRYRGSIPAAVLAGSPSLHVSISEQMENIMMLMMSERGKKETHRRRRDE